MIYLTRQCLKCKHYTGSKTMDGFVCRAFRAGIPEPILNATHNHTKPYPGDHGVQFEPLGREERAARYPQIETKEDTHGV